MTKNKALYAWFNEFMPFYRASSVPKDAPAAYGTYEYSEGAFGEGEVPIAVNLFFRTESEAIPDEKATELAKKFGQGRVLIPCDEGIVWLKKGSPWCQSIAYADDTAIKRRYINIVAEYLTFY